MMGVGGWAWVYAVLIVHNRIVVSFEAGQMARRYLWMLLACGAVGAAIAQLPGSQRIYAILAFMAVVPVIVVLWRLELWPMAAFGGIFGAVSYTVTMTAGSMIWPDFMGLWRAENLWGPTIAGVPIEELVWGALYGPSWALAMAFVVDARVADGGTDRNLRSRAHSKTPGR
jgi:hypothetical protein